MNSKIIFPFAFAIFLFPHKSYSTHIVGGEIRYIYLGNNKYEIHMAVYRDCYNGIPPYDDPASIGIFDSNNNLINSYNVNVSTPISITNSPSNCLVSAPSYICYQVATYTFEDSLPPIPGGYQIAYQRCCRSSNVTNVVNAQGIGITIYTRIPDSLYANDNSPVFFNAPFTFVCQNNPFTFDNYAIDQDSDSLVYSLCTPFNGADQTNPIPTPPNNPPYDSISWLAPYSLANMMGGVPLSIDPQTGLLTGTPNTTGVFDYGVCVKEYRNGIYIGETIRDFQVNVIPYVDIEEIAISNSIDFYPNPVTHSTTFKINSDLHLDNAELIFYDMLGKEVDRINNISSSEISFDRKNIVDGIYFYKFINDGKMIGTGKIILQ